MGICPQEVCPLFQEVGKGLCDVCKSQDEWSLVAQYSQRRSYLFQGAEFSWPVPQAFDFDRVYVNPFLADDDSQIVDLFLFKLALGKSEEIGLFFQFVQDFVDNLSVVYQVITCSDEDVVHVDEEFGRVAHLHFSEHAVHGALEGSGGVG